MNREEAHQALDLLRRVVAQARDDSALQNWGVIWMLHAVSNGAGFVATNWLWAQGHRTPGPFALLWACVLSFNFVTIFALKRGQSAGTRSFIERQIWAIWTTFIAGMVLLALVNWRLGLDRLFLPPVACILQATAFSMMGALMNRVWFVAAAGFAVAALVMTYVPDQAFSVLGGLWFLTQFSGGVALHRARLRRLSAGGAGARLV